MIQGSVPAIAMVRVYGIANFFVPACVPAADAS
jgi:hypothetical protein